VLTTEHLFALPHHVRSCHTDLPRATPRDSGTGGMMSLLGAVATALTRFTAAPAFRGTTRRRASIRAAVPTAAIVDVDVALWCSRLRPPRPAPVITGPASRRARTRPRRSRRDRAVRRQLVPVSIHPEIDLDACSAGRVFLRVSGRHVLGNHRRRAGSSTLFVHRSLGVPGRVPGRRER